MKNEIEKEATNDKSEVPADVFLNIQNSITLSRLIIYSEDDDGYNVELEGKNFFIRKGRNSSFVLPQKHASQMGMQMIMNQGLFLDLIEQDANAPREFIEAMMVHELREMEYVEHGLPDAHERAVHDETLYVLKHFVADIRNQYFDWAKTYRTHRKEAQDEKDVSQDNSFNHPVILSSPQISFYTKKDFLKRWKTSIEEVLTRRTSNLLNLGATGLRESEPKVDSVDHIPQGLFYINGQKHAQIYSFFDTEENPVGRLMESDWRRDDQIQSVDALDALMNDYLGPRAPAYYLVDELAVSDACTKQIAEVLAHPVAWRERCAPGRRLDYYFHEDQLDLVMACIRLLHTDKQWWYDFVQFLESNGFQNQALNYLYLKDLPQGRFVIQPSDYGHITAPQLEFVFTISKECCHSKKVELYSKLRGAGCKIQDGDRDSIRLILKSDEWRMIIEWIKIIENEMGVA